MLVRVAALVLACLLIAGTGPHLSRADTGVDATPSRAAPTSPVADSTAEDAPRTHSAGVPSAPSDSVQSDATPPDSSRHPNTIPYRTDRSLFYHALALPSYVLDAATWPLGVTVRFLENNFPSIFVPKPVTKGVRPLAELGGPNGVEVGVMLFHHDLWDAGHDVRLSGEIAARESWDVELQYTVPSPLGPTSYLQFFGEYTENNRRRFFLGGNASDPDLDEAQFYNRRLDTRALMGYQLAPRVSGETQLQYEHIRTRPSDEDPVLGQRIVGQPGLGVVDLATVQTEVAGDFTRTTVRNTAHRRYAGTVLIGRVGYSQSLTDDQFRYATLVGEVQQYLPLPGLPPSRRLALRARVEKVEPLFDGDAIPFYNLPGLGGQESLRGFLFDRFVNDGTLLLNAEYRYPIWDTFDAVVFVDAGQSFNGFGDVAADRFQFSYGGGVHLLSGRKLGGRLEAAYSEDGVQVILTVTPTFGTGTLGD
jgi:hypothetical protein